MVTELYIALYNGYRAIIYIVVIELYIELYINYIELYYSSKIGNMPHSGPAVPCRQDYIFNIFITFL